MAVPHRLEAGPCDRRRKSTEPLAVKIAPPALPKGGGAVTGIGQSFQPNAFTGTAGLSISVPTSPCRGFEPQLGLQYSSGSGNGVFGIGFGLAIPSISRKTAQAIPRYDDSDTFVMSEADDLVPVEGLFCPLKNAERGFVVMRYRPRTEGLFARIEKWENSADHRTHWRVTTKDNVTSIYGNSEDARIADPVDDAAGQPRVFQWLIERTDDARGNQIVYAYRKVLANTYIHKIKYGNYRPKADPASDDWHFEVGFAYSGTATLETLGHARGTLPGQLPADRPRPDPFSSYKSGFEIRTALRCIRISMAHRFEGEADGKLFEVSAMELSYRDSESASALSLLEAVTQIGYRAGAPPKAMPPLVFDWSPLRLGRQTDREFPQSTPFKPLRLEAGHSVPGFLERGAHQMVDLYGEGLPGILYTDADTVLYSRPMGDGSYAAASAAQAFPIDRDLQGPENVLMDLAGEGKLDLVVNTTSRAGYYASTRDGNWEPFRSFASVPTQLRDPHRQMVDVSGDGLADLLLFEADAVTVYPALGKLGYDRSFRQRTQTAPLPLTRQPSAREAIHFTDLFGDGGSHLVRIRDGSVECWPNLGHGRFGSKVEMANAPRFGGEFDASRLFLTDVDGSGTTDLVYAYADRVDIFRNENGNRFSAPISVRLPRRWNDLSQIGFADVLGNGSACLVFTSVNNELGLDHQYYDFTGGVKPYLLTGVDNNMGATTVIRYSPSTRFYLADKAAGRPWMTRLPFPVQVVEQIETIDRIGGSSLVAGYSYHHGYFDPVDREFRGFGRVDRTDAESFEKFSSSDGADHSLHLPPVLTKTWYHTGACAADGSASHPFAADYYQGDDSAQPPPDSVLDTAFQHADAEREGYRALHGQMLREEIYGLDGQRNPELRPPELAQHPYAVTESNFQVRLIQPASPGRHAVCFAHPRETISWHYERNPADPRVSHALTLQVDEFGNVLAEAAIAYGRRQPESGLAEADQKKQTRRVITLTTNRVTHAIDDAHDYHAPLPAETRTFELTGFAPANDKRFSFDEWTALWASDQQIPHGQVEDGGPVHKRLIAHARTFYRPDDLGASSNDDPLALLPLGLLQPLALPGETCQLAFTPALLDTVYVRNGRKLLPADPAEILAGGGADRGGYVDLDRDGHWWVPSGRVFLSPNGADTAADELAWARQHFFLPHRTRDALHTGAHCTESVVSYDEYDLLIVEARDPLGNLVKADHDYRVLKPRLVTDFNGNRSAAAYDSLGMISATAVMGKEAENVGDTLQGLDADLSLAEVQAFMLDPQASAASLLANASTRIVYDLGRYQRTRQPATADQAVVTGQPPFAATLARETHASDPLPTHGLRIQISFAYADGLGRALQTKNQAESGDAPQRAAPILLTGGDVGPGALTLAPGASDSGAAQSPRWVGSGRTVYNNKGLPVRQYEPYFSTTHLYEPERELTDAGVTSMLFHDPLGRLVATRHPDHSWEKVVFNPWRQASWDVNDTVLSNPKDDPDVGELFQRLSAGDDAPSWYEQRCGGALGAAQRAAADQAAAHAGTPSLSHFDALGRAMLTVADNGKDAKYETRATLDIAGRPLELIDANGRIAMRYAYDLLGNRMLEVSIDAGARWVLNDAAGSPLLNWDSQDRRFRSAFDTLRRPVAAFMREGEAPEVCLGQTVYGESRSKPEAGNLRGKVVQIFDQAGIITSDEYDFKGNLLRSQRQLAHEYWKALDWSSGDRPPLETQVYTQLTNYDAFNRPTQLTAPDNSVTRHHYNRTRLLERVEANLRGANAVRSFVGKIDYNAKGQRTQIDSGNGVKTTYAYDPLTHRLVRLLTLRGKEALQDLRYSYDPTGNITQVRDEAQATIFFSGQVVAATSDYSYDAVYRLIEASGREHRGQHAQPQSTWNDALRSHLPQPGDGRAMRNYSERYRYDAVGNLKQLIHQADQGDWTRTFDHGKDSNRLGSTSIGAATESYAYDDHGNMTRLPHLPRVAWDCGNQLRVSERQIVNSGAPERTWYVYDASGQRIRQVTVAATAAGQKPVRTKERVYLGGFEVYREYRADGVSPRLELETLHIMDDQQRIALVETTTKESGLLKRARRFFCGPPVLIRYALGNHLGSASLELDANARIISHEEYTPFGSTSYQAVRSQTETAKRYRYSGKERDDCTGLYYYGARYYAPWLGRWTSPDPAGTIDGLNLYAFVSGNPVTLRDHLGLCGRPPPSGGRRGAVDVGSGRSGKLVEFTYSRAGSVDKREREEVTTGLGRPWVKHREKAIEARMTAERFEMLAPPETLRESLMKYHNLHLAKFDLPAEKAARIGYTRQQHDALQQAKLKDALAIKAKEIDYGQVISFGRRAAARAAVAKATDTQTVIDNVVRQVDELGSKDKEDPVSRQAAGLFLLREHFKVLAASSASNWISELGAAEKAEEDPRTLKEAIQSGKDKLKEKAKETATELAISAARQVGWQVLRALP